MQLSNILFSIITLSLVCKSLGAPTENKKRDDDPVVVKLTTTVHNIATNTKIVEGTVSTRTNTVVNTDTTTTTRYTATVTSTVLGTPVTYTTVAPTPIDSSNIKVPTDTVSTTSQSSSIKAIQTTDVESTTTNPPTPATTSTPPATTSSTFVTDSNDNGPTITDIANIPTSTDSWIIDNITTSQSDGVCIVDYDYYATGEDETVTSTSTIYYTVTRT